MPRNLSAAGPISVVKFARDVFSGLGQKRQNRLITLLPSVLWVVALARSHLVAEQRVHRGAGVQRDLRESNVRRLPNPLAHYPLHLQQLPGDLQMQGSQKPPEGALRRQS